jgi:Leucine Rich Repeat (LRR) protein
MSKSTLINGCAMSFFLCAAARGQSGNSASYSSDRIDVSPEERSALIAIFNATEGTHWKNHDGWLGPPMTECTWRGVECGPSAGGVAPLASHIAGLKLSDNNLVGRIPSSISSLVHLQILDIVGNQLTGKLPDSLIERWLANTLWLVADPSQLTDISVIDSESAPTSLLCGRQRIILRADARRGRLRVALSQCNSRRPHDLLRSKAGPCLVG